MDTSINRERAIQALGTVLKQGKNAQLFEKYIYDKVKGESADIYNWSVYQVLGFLLQSRERMRAVAEEIKEGRIGWRSPTYGDVISRLEEYDEYLAKPFEVVDGVVECGKCQSKKTWSVQKQTRSSDEPMTTFSRCVECGHQWTYAG